MPNKETGSILTYTDEIVTVIWKDGQRVAIEFENGHIQRYFLEPSDRRKSAELRGTNLPVNAKGL